MKRVFTISAVVLLTASVFAQAPQKMSYQAVIRNSSNSLVTSSAVGMKISILQTSAGGAAVYTETQTATTNANGLVTIEIGGGTPVAGTFGSIDWSAGPYFIKTETDPTGGTSYTIAGTSQLLSVPYALYAKTSGTPGTNIGDLQYWNGTAWVVLPRGTIGQVLAINSSNIPIWQNASELSLLPPTATNQAATNVQSFSATLNGTVNANNLSAIVAFEWGLTTSYGSTVTAAQSPVTGTSDVAVSTNLTGLQSATTYHYRLRTSNAVNYTYSSDLSFTTELSAPQLTKTYVISISAFSAALAGNITYDGGSAVTARGVCWGTASTPTIANNKTTDGTGTGSFTSSITGLALSSLYYVRAYATNSVGTTYSNEISLTTQSGVITLSTASITSILTISAASGGNITADGGSAITARGVCWGTAPTPTTANSNTTDGSGTGSFTSSITGLSINTTYYVRAYATNSVGTTYGNERSFSTGIGASYQGGIIAYILQAGDPGYIAGETHGLIAAPSDQSTGMQWYNGSYTTTDATGTAIGTGNANTNTIVASQGAGSYAAQLCADLVLGGYSDWYLPSKDELNKLYLNKAAIGGFAISYYWSSSEDDNFRAWNQYFVDGYQYSDYKTNPRFVRAVRAF